MARSKAPGRRPSTHGATHDGAAAPSGAEGNAAAQTSESLKAAAVPAPIANVQIIPPSASLNAEVSVENLIREFEEARALAIKHGQAYAAVTATMAKAKLAGLFKERSETKPASLPKFDGNYIEAARRVAFLLRLAENQKAQGQKR
jgi:hypothetical protein